MPRRTLDARSVFTGFTVAIVMLMAGVLLILGHSSVSNQVYNELAVRKITFPASNSKDITSLPAADAAAMSKYAGQLLTTGPQAQTYADDFMTVQINGVAGGKTYAELLVSAAASRKNATVLEIEAANVFRGETIRGQLLNAYAFWKIGQIMFYAAIATFIVAIALLIGSGLGLARLRRAAAAVQIQPAPAPIPAVETV